MKIIIYAMTGKSKEESTSKDVDKACDFLERITYFVDENFKKFKWTGLKCMCDSTRITLEN